MVRLSLSEEVVLENTDSRDHVQTTIPALLNHISGIEVVVHSSDRVRRCNVRRIYNSSVLLLEVDGKAVDSGGVCEFKNRVPTLRVEDVLWRYA